MYSCAFGGAVWVVFLLYWYECLSVVLACEPTCRHCVYLVLWTRKVLCGSFCAPYRRKKSKTRTTAGVPKQNLNTYRNVHSFLHSFTHLFIHLFVRSFIHSFIHSFLPSFVSLPIYAVCRALSVCQSPSDLFVLASIFLPISERNSNNMRVLFVSSDRF